MPAWRIANNGTMSGTIAGDRISITAHHLAVWDDSGSEPVAVKVIPFHKHASAELVKRKDRRE